MSQVDKADVSAIDDFESVEFGPPAERSHQERLIVDLGAYEGPLDLLLALARDQKVDLAQISVLALAEQYLAFFDKVRTLSLEVAADYLVMAAWLAYLKSRLLLPTDEDEDGPSADELAAALAFRLRRLEAMRNAAARLMNRNRLSREIFARGMPEPVVLNSTRRFQASLYDLLEAYSAQRSRSFAQRMQFKKRSVISLAEARERLVRLIGDIADWAPMDALFDDYIATPAMRATARASSLSASLELTREGQVELRQVAPFSPVYIRKKEPGEPKQETRTHG